jgi:hypothetical protein
LFTTGPTRCMKAPSPHHKDRTVTVLDDLGRHAVEQKTGIAPTPLAPTIVRSTCGLLLLPPCTGFSHDTLVPSPSIVHTGDCALNILSRRRTASNDETDIRVERPTAA